MAGIYTTSSSLMEKAIRYCETYGRTDVEIVGFDASEAQVKALQEGKVDGLVLQNPYGMGYATVVACARSIMNEGNEAVVNSGYTWLDQNNIEEEAIQSILY
jgi:ribose transport system substrate-binding protein